MFYMYAFIIDLIYFHKEQQNICLISTDRNRNSFNLLNLSMFIERVSILHCYDFIITLFIGRAIKLFLDPQKNLTIQVIQEK